ncbi:Retrovirus-related Pol polyprotein from transposon RE1 [Glycine soja]|uniref:Retrovirus-related Pol polyprotein from transposon RE1 n=1 Tax=Glycine soja TaxID=3848 RepID=A0A445KBX1_GLYSO|nr:Retrovirus-related Pol polyprotein from transposon RE1 [Glycine soja]
MNFLGLADALGVTELDELSNGKASILKEPTRLLKDLLSQIESLKKDSASLFSQTHYELTLNPSLQCLTLNQDTPNVSKSLQLALLITCAIWPPLNLLPRLQAMEDKIKALEANNTWTLEFLPPEKMTIGCKWLYLIKYNSDGSIERYKACLVAKGYSQLEGFDFTDVFASVTKLTTMRTVLSIAATKNWPTHQMDVSNAFLHGNLHEEVYMQLSPGFHKQGESRVCRLNKSVYGLKQAPCTRFTTFWSALLEAGFTQSRADYSMFLFTRASHITILLVYVDDIVIIVTTPLDYNHTLVADHGEVLSDPTSYRRLVGRLLYLTVTRPDITYAVNLLSQFMSSPRDTHWQAALRAVRYIKFVPDHGILLSSNSSLRLHAYCDADWASCPTSRRSTIGYCIVLGPSLLCWRTKK